MTDAANNADIQQVSTALVEFDKVEAGIAALRTQYGGVVFDVKTTKGLDDAKAARLAIREPRYEVERVRKSAKAPLLSLGKSIDAQAAKITAALLEIEGPIDEQIKAEETRKEAERQAKIEAERKRVEAIQARIQSIRDFPMGYAAKPADAIVERMNALSALPIGDDFEEFQQQAADAKAGAMDTLRAMQADRLAHEAQQAAIKAEREELARLRKEAAEREAAERAEREAREAAERKAREEEQARKDAEIAALRAQLAAAQQPESAPVDDKTMPLALEPEEAPPEPHTDAAPLPPDPVQPRIQGIPSPSFDEIVEVLARFYMVNGDTVRHWIQPAQQEAIA